MLDCHGEMGAKLAEPVGLRSIPHLWSRVVGSESGAWTSGGISE